MLLKLESFYDDYENVLSDINHVLREEKDFKPIAGDVDTIRLQLKEFKVCVKQVFNL